MSASALAVSLSCWSHPVRGAWIEMLPSSAPGRTAGSHPVRGAWIEIVLEGVDVLAGSVAPREGCVD